MTDLNGPGTTMWRIADLERRVGELEQAIALATLALGQLAADVKAASGP